MRQVAVRLGLSLSKEAVEQAKTDAYIVERLKLALYQLKQCRTPSEWIDYRVILAAIAPVRETAAASKSHYGDGRSIAKVCSRLAFNSIVRYPKGKEPRPPAIQLAITDRAAFDDAVLMQSGELKVGDRATSHGRECTVIEIDREADMCTLSFSSNGVEVTETFSCIYKGKDAPGKAPFPKGSARLTRAPPSLRPTHELRKDQKAEEARPKVEALFDAEGARSPAQRDRVRRRLGVGLYEHAQALIVYARYAALYKLFCIRHPDIDISFSTFKKLRPWYVKRAKEETCCCKQCDNFKQQQTTLHSLVSILQRLIEAPPSADDDIGDDEGTEAWAGQPVFEKLMLFCALQSKSDMVRFVLCDGAMDGAGKEDCINGKCPLCGFKKYWSGPEGLRQHLVDRNNNVRQSAPAEFQTEVKWMRIKSSKKSSPGEAAQPSYEQRRGTIVQFLDEFERETMQKYPHHRFTVQRQKATAGEFERNRWPGWLQLDIDFAMDGTIPPPQGRSMQSDHWVPMGFTLFPAIASWLDTKAWKSCDSPLSKGDAVTVEPTDTWRRSSTEPAAESYWAEVVSVPVCSQGPIDPETQVYGVRPYGAAKDVQLVMIERRYLRHRKLHTTAFIHITDDKTHDSYAAQTFIKKTLDYLQVHSIHQPNSLIHASTIHASTINADKCHIAVACRSTT